MLLHWPNKNAKEKKETDEIEDRQSQTKDWKRLIWSNSKTLLLSAEAFNEHTLHRAHGGRDLDHIWILRNNT